MKLSQPNRRRSPKPDILRIAAELGYNSPYEPGAARPTIRKDVLAAYERACRYLAKRAYE